jgi:hypothetical protein
MELVRDRILERTSPAYFRGHDHHTPTRLGDFFSANQPDLVDFLFNCGASVWEALWAFSSKQYAFAKRPFGRGKRRYSFHLKIP